MAYQTLLMILPLITAPYIARVLGPQEIGRYAYTNSIAHYFSMLITLGLANYGNRSIAEHNGARAKITETFWSIYSMQFCCGVLVSALYGLYCALMADAAYARLSLLWSFYILSAMLDISWFFFGMEQFRAVVLKNTVVKILACICVFAFVKERGDTWKYVCIMSLSFLLGQLLLWPQLTRHVSGFQWKYLRIVKTHIKPNLILFLPVLAVSIYRQMDKVMLGSISGMTQLGFYENAEKAVGIPLGLISAVTMAMLPRMTAVYARGETETERNYMERCMRLVMCMAFALCFGIASVSDRFALLYFGKGFEACGPLIAAMSIVLPFMAWAEIIRRMHLIPHKKDGVFVKSLFTGAAFNLAFNIALIPKLGALGAIIGTIAAEVTVALYQTFHVKKEIEVAKYFVKALPCLAAGILMFFAVRFAGQITQPTVWGLCIQVVSGAAIYMLFAVPYMKKYLL